MECRICGNTEGNKTHRVREMMYGLGEEFEYIECRECGCLQIAEVPDDMARYYPKGYLGSFRRQASGSPLKRFVEGRLNQYALLDTGPLGSLVSCLFPSYLLTVVGRAGIRRDSRILDVGCGSGDFLHALSELGFTSLVGVDPYIEEPTDDGRVSILKQTIHDLSESSSFDFIIFNHSFEHIPDQLETLLKAADLLDEEGVCLIRIPVKSETIWSMYGVHWVQIDAPRHLFIHTETSLQRTATRAGLRVRDIIFDSTEFQLWGSEQYKMNIPLEDARSYQKNPERGIFTRGQMREFRRMAGRLNRTGQGDQAAFFLVRDTRKVGDAAE